ncbi:MAG: cation-transporting P-type ATPase [Polyangiaceae bacterium]|nr:cation-transporting P-type ATPase [Polyangiaceae bacterium]
MAQTLARLGTSEQAGLSEAEVESRRARYGSNRLPEAPPVPLIARLVAQFTSPMVLLLLGAALATLLVNAFGAGREGGASRHVDAAAIFAIVVLNALLGLAQERKAEQAIRSLSRLLVRRVRVRRGGAGREVAVEEVVPGDLLELEAGDLVAADARLVRSADLAADESTLTGESVPVDKDAGAVFRAGAPPSEQAGGIYFGTNVVRGAGLAVVVATGPSTELGRISGALNAPSEPTPFERRVHAFGKALLWACAAASAALFAAGALVGGRPLGDLVLEAVSFAVAIIPEGLPAIATITLAVGAQRMAKRGVIARNLGAIETLGSVSTICSDKTGTLTKNEMAVRELFVAGGRHQVGGEGSTHAGDVADAGTGGPAPAAQLAALFETAAVCNHASLGASGAAGDPTEVALLVLAAKDGADVEALRRAWKVESEEPFDAARQRMVVSAVGPEGERITHVKGSVEAILPLAVRYEAGEGLCSFDEGSRAIVRAEAERMSRRALRVLALARGPAPEAGQPVGGLTLLGLVGMMDPPRPGVREAVDACRDAGVRVVMITGDHPLTAKAVAEELGIYHEGDEVLTGADLGPMGDDELGRRARAASVFARTTPEQKLRIVRALQAGGEAVAMTGDGVNDAPALRAAGVGVAMGKQGTDVARRAADAVIGDDNFATLVEGVRQGRAIYYNIKKSVFYLLSSNVGLAAAVFAVALVGRGWQPLSPLMILSINFVTNGLPALALAVEPPEASQMAGRPPGTGANFLDRRDLGGLLASGGLMGALAIALYTWFGAASPAAPELGRTAVFAFLGLCPLAHAWNCRSPRASLFAQRPRLPRPLLLACFASALIHVTLLAAPWAQSLLHLRPMSGALWALVALLSLSIVPAVEAAKALERKVFAVARGAHGGAAG